MEPVYFEVRGIEFHRGRDPQLKDYSGKIKNIRDQLMAIHKRPQGKEELKRSLARELEEVSEASMARGQAFMAEELEGLAREVNDVKGVNLDSKRIAIFPLGISGKNFCDSCPVENRLDKFLGYEGGGAAWGYSFGWTGDVAYIALRGKINPDKVKRSLKKRGYAVENVDAIPRGSERVPTLPAREEAPRKLERTVELARVPEKVAKPKPRIKTVYDVLARRAGEWKLCPGEVQMRLEGTGKYVDGGKYERGRITEQQAEFLYEMIEKAGKDLK